MYEFRFFRVALSPWHDVASWALPTPHIHTYTYIHTEGLKVVVAGTSTSTGKLKSKANNLDVDFLMDTNCELLGTLAFSVDKEKCRDKSPTMTRLHIL